MDSKNIVKKDVLLRKIQEYFAKNPKKDSAIFHSDLGGNTYWKVQREGRSYNITEVTTKRESFVVEAGPLPKPGDEKTGVGGKPLYNPNGGPTPQAHSPSASANKPGLKPGQIGPTGTVAPNAVKPLPTRKPEPMDGGGSSPADKAKMKAHVSTTQDMMKWQPNNPDSEFSKSLLTTKDLGQSIKKMPPDHFKRNFGWTGATSADQLVGNPDLMTKTSDYLSQHNPVVAQVLGRKLPAGSSAPKPVAAGVKKEGRLVESPEFASFSTLFTKAMTPPFDHGRLSNALRAGNTAISKIVDANERNQAGAMIGALTTMVDSTTAGGGSSVTMKRTVTAGKVNLGKRLVEEDDSKKKDKKEEPKPKKKDDVEAGGALDAPTEEPEAKPEPEPEPEAPAPEADPASQPSKDQEQTVMADRMAGQTIKNVAIDLGGKGGTLSIELVGTKIPATLHWEPSGKVIFTFKNRPYILRHG